MNNHPYKKFGNTKLWKLLDSAFDDLVKNQDIELKTSKNYVVGYLCKKISKTK